jgi:hypothetical protein
MLLIMKLIALAIAVWFYITASEAGESPVKWAVIGLIGYLIVWKLLDLAIAVPLSAAVGKKGVADFIIDQIPALGGLAAAHFIRKKLLSNVNPTT